ncbi:MAG TPA: cytosol nonspecific dipeptidase, partial [Rikenellaceae bacterium]|nr:cytosol nonspecific dipeptidase [Rikenellaceae bacterium]
MDNSKIFEIFDQITKIPRESGNEEKITAFLINFAKERDLEYRTDSANNVVIIKPATKGMESAPVVVLQSHSDMVCEKNSDSSFNFETDPINYIEENGWLVAKETTLGADCGIGMAAQLAILASNDVVHGPIECLFTTEEETGLKGAKELKPGFITGKMLINLDSEDEGELFIGCAGGIDTTARYSYKEVAADSSKMFLKTLFFGATGGHSGDDIHKNRGNANQFLFRFLYNLLIKAEFDICQIDGGNKRNAIAREAYAIIAFDKTDFELVKSLFNRLVAEIKDEYSISDPNIEGTIEISESFATAVEKQVAEKLILSLNGIPHGVLAMSQEIEGFVETSTNLAAVKMDEP